MAKEPDNLVLSILRDIRATQDEHSEEFKKVHAELKKVQQEIVDLRETTVTVAGLSVKANVKTENLQAQIDEIRDRVSRLEEKV